jgi:dihydropyrimidine dehydrogenase (NADP+)/dihydropyrimidine dehydrogenase (NAD+) subunit PreA
MPTLETTVDDIRLPNPFIIGSGPPGTNANVVGKALEEGWGAVVIKTISLDASKVVNVAPRYARLRTVSKEVIGWQNIELISDRPFEVWIDELKMLKDKYPDGVVIASIMEEYHKDRWIEIVERTQATGVAGFELNFSCPHGLPERKMGAAMGQDCGMMHEVCEWVMSAAKIPVWAKLTPNVTSIAAGAEAALSAGCHGVAAINTILSVMGVDLETLRPEPTVEGYTVPGGYSCMAVKPIALRMVKECAETIRDKFPGRSLSAIGGIESGKDAAQFILLGADTVQVCTGVMKFGYDCVAGMKDELLNFMARHNFETISDFKGHSLQYFTTHADLVRRQAEAKAAAREKAAAAKAGVSKDGEWKGDSFVKQSDALARG